MAPVSPRRQLLSAIPWVLSVVAVLLVLLTDPSEAQSSTSGHDCIFEDPSLDKYAKCVNPLAKDPNCSTHFTHDLNGWARMDCDIAAISAPAKEKNSKWFVVHAGVCDTHTETIGEYFYSAEKSFNYYGLRPCLGLIQSNCLASYGGDTCNATHISWTADPKVVASTKEQGFNPPELINAYRTDPKARFVFLHEYGDYPSDYPWATNRGCTDGGTPVYICVSGADPDYDAKFPKIQKLLEGAFTKIPTFSCTVKVVDSRNSTAVPGYDGSKPNKNRFADIPCSGLYPQVASPGWELEVAGKPLGALQQAIQAQEAAPGEKTPGLGALEDWLAAIDIALAA